MQDSVDNKQYKRRRSDLLGNAPTGEPLLALLREVLSRLEDLERIHGELGSAFVLNDLKKPDYDGHRRAHLALVKAGDVVEGYKQAATKTVIGWLLAGLFAIFMTGLGAWISSHLK